MTTQSPQLSTDQINTAKAQANAIGNAITAPVIDNNTFVFFAAFDGTNNGANPPADGSGDSQTTAVKQLFDQVLPNGLPIENKGGSYEPGVGTPDSQPFSSFWNIAITAQTITNAQERGQYGAPGSETVDAGYRRA